MIAIPPRFFPDHRKDATVSLLNLSVSSVPFSINGVAGIDLIVSVIDADGAPCTGLQDSDFHVHWLLNGADEEIKSIAVHEYDGAHGLPELPGVYDITVQSEDSAWSPIASNIVCFYIATKRGNDLGQTLYTVEYPDIAT